eukprot:31152-Chlamydomonas_euryale.AAC.1
MKLQGANMRSNKNQPWPTSVGGCVKHVCVLAIYLNVVVLVAHMGWTCHLLGNVCGRFLVTLFEIQHAHQLHCAVANSRVATASGPHSHQPEAKKATNCWPAGFDQN